MFVENRPHVLCVVVGALAALALAGCAGSLRSAGVNSDPSKAAYIKRADAQCTRQNILFDEAFSHEVHFLGVHAELREESRRVQSGFSLERKDLVKLRTLAQPPADRSALAAVWDARTVELNATIAESKLLFTSYRNIPAARLKNLSEIGLAAGARYRRLTKGFGFKVCGTSAGARIIGKLIGGPA